MAQVVQFDFHCNDSNNNKANLLLPTITLKGYKFYSLFIFSLLKKFSHFLFLSLTYVHI